MAKVTSVALAPAARLVGLRVTVEPAGTPLADSVTAARKVLPPDGPMAMW
jgi:hypothetical protein